MINLVCEGDALACVLCLDQAKMYRRIGIQGWYDAVTSLDTHSRPYTPLHTHFFTSQPKRSGRPERALISLAADAPVLLSPGTPFA